MVQCGVMVVLNGVNKGVGGAKKIPGLVRPWYFLVGDSTLVLEHALLYVLRFVLTLRLW